MRKLFLLALAALGVACTKPSEDKGVSTDFVLESVIAEEAGPSGKSARTQLNLIINGATFTTSEVREETLSRIVFGYADSPNPDLTSGTISIDLAEGDIGLDGLLTGGTLSLNDDNGIEASTSLRGLTPEFTVLTEDELGPTSGIIRINGTSVDGVDIRLQVFIDIEE